jgi:predicted AAA+ superfamily ATPase
LISNSHGVNFPDMYKNRLISDRLKKLTATFPVVVLTGARQTGKSTLLANIFPEKEAIVFDSAVDLTGVRRDADMFLDNHPTPLILDEIQYAPEVVSAIKRRVDKNRKPGLYILTGSQQWSVMKSISESLAGRAVFLNLDGFCLAEVEQRLPNENWLQRWMSLSIDEFAGTVEKLRSARTLYEQLWRGWLPAADTLDLEYIPDFYRSYIQTYVERDARVQIEIGDWQQFGKFAQLVSALTAQEINFSQLGREIGINYQTAKSWLVVLKSTFQWFEIPAYSGNTIKKISSKSKGYISDTGLACALNLISSHKALGGHPMLGSLFETAVVAEIRKLSNCISTPPQAYHWRSHSGAEIDILLERDAVYYPIEIKAKSSPNKNDTKGISAFRKTYPKIKVAPGLIICPCEKFDKISENDYALPWDSI